MGFIFPVTDNGERHMVGLFGGTILNVDVELENHPIMDGTFEKLAALQNRKPGQPNPFMPGEASFRKFIEVMLECTKAQIIRHSGII